MDVDVIVVVCVVGGLVDVVVFNLPDAVETAVVGAAT